MATNKKVTRVEGGNAPSSNTTWAPTAEAKGRASQNRLFAGILWLLAIIAEIVGIIILVKNPTPLTAGLRIWLIVVLVIDLILLILGSSYWKKANRLDPPSNQSPMFMIQSQLGVVMAVICFLPVVILAFIKKEYIVGAIAALFLIGGGAASADYHPASKEQYAQQTAEVETLTGKNLVYWTKSGSKYHLYEDCRYINTSKTTEIFQGTVAQARELKNITELCSACRDKVMKEKNITQEQLQQAENAATGAN